MTENAASTTPDTKNEEKLYAGKYKTIEDLETAVINKDKEYSKIYNEHTDLKNKYAVPENYSLPEDIQLPSSEIIDLKSIAKTSNLSQLQFLSTVKQIEARNKLHADMIEQNRKSIGEEKIKVLGDYVTKNYPQKLQDPILNHLLKDREAMDEAFKHRDQLLNTTIPGMNLGTGAGGKEKFDGQKDLMQLAKEHHEDPRDKTKKDRYIAMASQIGHARQQK